MAWRRYKEVVERLAGGGADAQRPGRVGKDRVVGMPRSSWGGGWSGGAEQESEASAGGVRAVIRQILEVVPGGILRARQDDLRGGFGLVDRAGC